MKTIDVDVVVLGSGFAGSLTALLLRRIGRSVALLDHGRHPRFAIGESSTPIGNMVLWDLAVRYDLPRLVPLCKYGPWRETYPELSCGLKRGFSYFAHRSGAPFQPSSRHENELLVAASADDEHSDTQWLRSDIDAFLCREAAGAGVIVLEETKVAELKRTRESLSSHGDVELPSTSETNKTPAPFNWTLQCQRGDGALVLRCELVIDATGAAGVVPRSLGIESDGDRFQTHSRAIFSHFVGVEPWDNVLRELGGRTQDHPFPSDHAAQHHLLDGAWLWMLRFSSPGAPREPGTDRLCSAGLVLDERRYPLDDNIAADAEWQSWLNRYPSIARMFEEAQHSDVPGRLIRTRRLQRRWKRFAGAGWVLLPHTAGFVDPLHSTGIAHSLCAIERLVGMVEQSADSTDLAQRLPDYERTLQSELDLIDALVAGCFDSLANFDIFAAYSMLYFAAATTYEHQRAEKKGVDRPAFLCADNDGLRAAVAAVREQMPVAAASACDEATDRFFEYVAKRIAPFNRVGLCDRSVRNMYRYTVAPI